MINGRSRLDSWIRKCIINYTWNSYKDRPPSIYDIKVWWKYEKDSIRDNEETNIPYIEAFSFNQAFAEAGRLGLAPNRGEPFYWVHKISGKAEKKRYDFASDIAFRNFQLAKKEKIDESFFEELKFITGAEDLYQKLINIESLNDRFLSNDMVILVFKAQGELYIEKQRQLEEERKKNFKSEYHYDPATRLFTPTFYGTFSYRNNLDKYEPNGLMTVEFINWVNCYKERKENEEERMEQKIERGESEKSQRFGCKRRTN